jgi:hypothetical protein
MPTTATMEMPIIDNANSADNAINANNVSALHAANQLLALSAFMA